MLEKLTVGAALINEKSTDHSNRRFASHAEGIFENIYI
jgi:hypothetical protein